MKHFDIESIKAAAKPEQHLLQDHMTLTEFAEHVGCVRTVIYRAINNGRITPTFIGKNKDIMIDPILNAEFKPREKRPAVEKSAAITS